METTVNLFETIWNQESIQNQSLSELKSAEHRYAKDLKLNLKAAFDLKEWSETEMVLAAIAIAANNGQEGLLKQLKTEAEHLGVDESLQAEATALASLLSANNVLYRFRHFVNKESYEQLPARMRMNIMMQPQMGKELFELISLQISAINGCEACVKAHEQSLIELGCNETRIWEGVRMASILTSTKAFLS